MYRSNLFALSLVTLSFVGDWRVTSFAQVTAASSESETAATLDSLKLRFDVDRAELLKPLRDLDAKYEEQLNQLMDQVTETGNLKQALAVKAELENYKTGSIPANGDEFPGLKRLQEVYSAAKIQRMQTMNEGLAPLYTSHRQRLVALQKRLTQEKKLDEAVQVQTELKKLSALSGGLGVTDASTNRFFGSATKGQPHENSIGMKFVPVPISGNPAGPRTVLFSIWETRVRDYETFVRRTKQTWPKPNFKQTEMHAAVMVTWDDANEFCKWLTDKERDEGKIGLKDRYRLPTDHEWSCAIGIGADEDADATPSEKNGKIANVYPWGNSWPPPPESGNFCGEETARNPIPGRPPIQGYKDDFERMAPVGKFPANQFGLHDLAGNATELVEDWYKPESPTMRGSCYSWRTPGRFLSSFRIGTPRNSRSSAIGFRCVLEAGGSQAVPASGKLHADADRKFLEPLP